MRSVRGRLLLGLFWAGLAAGLTAGLVTYQKAYTEATELADLQLRQLALALPSQLTPNLEKPMPGEPSEAVFIRVWDAAGRLQYASEGAPGLLRQPDSGFASLTAADGGWRVFSLRGETRSVQVAQPDSVRRALAAHLAWRVILPLLVFLPVFGLLVYAIVGRALRPLERMAGAVAGRSPDALQPLDLGPLSPELEAITAAVNRLLAQIDEAMSAQRRFVADAAHELRSPLTALKLQLQLAEKAAGETAAHSAFGKLHERVDRASHVVRQMLTLARHDAAAAARFASIDLHQLALRAATEQSVLAESRGIDLGIGAASAAVTVHGDRDGLGVLLNNLVDNAVRYTQAGGQVDISTGIRADGRAVLLVADNGPGVPPRERERLFDRFYRPDGNLVWGCGLGLAIVKNVADQHHAELRLRDGLGGKGFGVEVVFPLGGASAG